MAAFDLAVLLRPSRSNVAEPNAEFLAAEREEERELGAVIDLDPANRKRKRCRERAQKREA